MLAKGELWSTSRMALLRIPQLDGYASGRDNAVTSPLHCKDFLLVLPHDSNRMVSQQGENLFQFRCFGLEVSAAETQGMMGSLSSHCWLPRRRS